MKKRLKSLCAVTIVTALLFSGSAVHATTDYSMRINELKQLLIQCETAGILVQREKMQVEILERFAGYLKEDEMQGENTPPLIYTKKCLDDIYTKTHDALNSYLNGTQLPQKMIEIENHGWVIDGGEIKNPVGKTLFSGGYGHFNQVMHDIPNMNSLGMSNIQTEIAPSSVIVPVSAVPGWQVGFCSDDQTGTKIDAEFTIEYNSEGNILKAENRSAFHPNVYMTFSQAVQTLPGKKYRIGGRVRAEGVRGQPWISASPDGFGTRNPLPLSERWTSFSFEVEAEECITLLRVVCEDLANGLYFDDLYFMDENGFNLLQNADFEDKEIARRGFDVDLSSIRFTLETLRLAEKNGVGVCLLLSPHYFPQFLYEASFYKDTGNFIKYNVHHPRAKEVIESYIRAIMPVVSMYESVTSICISNEPAFQTWDYPEFYLPEYHTFLQNKHKNIEALNQQYQTAYGSFEEIPMPDKSGEDGVFYDWVCFNDEVFARWHSWLAGIVREYSNLPIHSKVLNYLAPANDSNARWLLRTGTSIELFDQFSDIAGNDAHGYADDGKSFLNKMKWYDYLRSITGKPVYNSEDHVIRDREIDYGPLQAKHVYADLWQGAISGRDMSSIWVWERTYDPKGDFYGSILNRPDCVEAAGEATLDLQRFSAEVEMLQNAPADTALFYAKSAHVCSTDFLETMDYAYRILVENGQNVDFVSDGLLQRLKKYRRIIIPGTVHVLEEVLTALRNYQLQGGSIVILGSDSLTQTPYGKEHNADLLKEIQSESVILNQPDEFSALLRRENPYSLVDVKTGLPAEGLIWQVEKSNGQLLVSICNVEAKDLSVKLLESGKTVTGMKELITETVVSEVIDVKAKEVLLLRVSEDNLDEIENLHIENGKLLWNSGDNASSFNIYCLLDDGTLYYEGTTAEHVWEPVNGGYLVRAVGNNGKESAGKMLMWPNPGNVLVEKSEICRSNGNQIVVDLVYQNISNRALPVKLSVYTLDGTGKRREGAGFEQILMPGMEIHMQKNLSSREIKQIEIMARAGKAGPKIFRKTIPVN